MTPSARRGEWRIRSLPAFTAYVFGAGMFVGMVAAELDGARDWRVVAVCAAGAALNVLAAWLWRP